MLELIVGGSILLFLLLCLIIRKLEQNQILKEWEIGDEIDFSCFYDWLKNEWCDNCNIGVIYIARTKNNIIKVESDPFFYIIDMNKEGNIYINLSLQERKRKKRLCEIENKFNKEL